MIGGLLHRRPAGNELEEVPVHPVQRLGAGLFLSKTKPPTALVVGSNRMTIGAMRAIRDSGLTVPDDIALVAFDDFEWADLFHPRLTAIAQATAEMGELAVQMILSRLAEPELEPRKERLPAVFVHRESCGCPASHGAAAVADCAS
jgi:LacI family transcriptional regulator